MIKSMTGFGRGSYQNDSLSLDIEIRSLNSRFFDLKVKGISLDIQDEIKLRKYVKEKLIRGTITISILLNGEQVSSNYIFNKKKVAVIQNILNDIHITYGQRLGLGDIISSNDLIKPESQDISLGEPLFFALDKSIKELDNMREKEGELIYQDISKRAQKLKVVLENIYKISEKFSFQKHKNLCDKVNSLINSHEIDDNRLIQEVAYYVEKSDITEELVRCRSHFKLLESYLKLDSDVGKKINFIIQEILREVNTIGSKTQQLEITKEVVEIKDELEKIREQSQNIL
tara:strand:- start:258 stop:1118 length:861 start_codon:yes stop_codon:yes gene_type:complete